MCTAYTPSTILCVGGATDLQFSTIQGCLAEERSPMLQKHDTCCITLWPNALSCAGEHLWVEGLFGVLWEG